MTITLAQFQELAPAFTAKEARDGKLYVSVPKGGKVELDLKKNRWVVGSGSKYLKEITAAVKAAGFHVLSEANSWTYLDGRNPSELPDLIMAVCTAVADHHVLKVVPAKDGVPKHGVIKRESKTVKLSTLVKKASDSYVKSKNLETIKQVAARRTADPARYADKVKDVQPVPTDDQDDPREYVPQMFWKEVGIA
jgi:hypothetical protein